MNTCESKESSGKKAGKNVVVSAYSSTYCGFDKYALYILSQFHETINEILFDVTATVVLQL